MTPPASLDGALVACRTLRALGAQYVFGVPGTQNTAFYEAMRRVGLTAIVPTHELAAAFMAGAYYRSNGAPGILTTIAGPGLAYTLAGLAEARLDSAGLLYLVNGPRRDTKIGYTLQAIDQQALLSPVSKAVLSASSLEDIDASIRRAWKLALSGEPGPVVLQLASDIADASAPKAIYEPEVSAADFPPTASAIADAWQVIAKAKKPVLLVGQGAITAACEVQGLAERLGAPVVTTPSARGIVEEVSNLAMGFDVLKGSIGCVNALFDEADLIVVLGAKLGHNGSAGFGLTLSADKLLRIDTSTEALTSIYRARNSLQLSVRDFLARPEALSCRQSSWTKPGIAAHRAAIRTQKNFAEPRIAGSSPAEFYAALRRALSPQTCLVTDTGMHQVTARRHFEVLCPRGLLMPSDFQSMGFGLPAAIAARLADSSRPVVALIGDGGFRMTGFELATAVREKIALTVLVLNDASLNQIRLQQLSEYGSAVATRIGQIGFDAFAASVGAHYEFASSPMRLEAVLAKSLVAHGVTLIEVPVGDTMAIRRGAVAARARSIVRRTLGKVVTFLKDGQRKSSNDE